MSEAKPKTAKNRAEEIVQLVPNASDDFKLRAVIEGMTNEQVLLAYVAALESGKVDGHPPRPVKTPSPAPVAIDWEPLIGWVGRLLVLALLAAVAYLLFLGARAALSRPQAPDPAQTTVTLPSHAQPIYAALKPLPDTAKETAHLMAAMAVVQSEGDLDVGTLKAWLAAVGPDFRRMNPGLQPAGLDAPLMSSLRDVTGEPKLYAITEIPQPREWFGQLADCAVAAVNRDRVTWSPL